MDRLLAEEKYGAALAEARLAVTEAPEDPRAHYILGVLQRGLILLPEAERSLVRATELDPKMAAAHAELGEVREAREKDLGARGSYELALALEPRNEVALAGIRRLDDIDAMIDGLPFGAHEPGTPAGAVQAFLELARKDLAAAMNAHVDKRALSAIGERAGLTWNADSIPAFARGVEEALEEGEALELRGCRLNSTEAVTETEATVVTSVLFHRATSSARKEEMRKLMRSPEMEKYVGADVRRVYESLHPADQEAYLVRAATEGSRLIMPAKFQLRRSTGGEWLIYEVEVGDGVALHLKLSDVIIEGAARSRAEDPPGPLGAMLPLAISIGVVALIVLLVVLAVRGRRPGPGQPLPAYRPAYPFFLVAAILILPRWSEGEMATTLKASASTRADYALLALLHLTSVIGAIVLIGGLARVSLNRRNAKKRVAVPAKPGVTATTAAGKRRAEERHASSNDGSGRGEDVHASEPSPLLTDAVRGVEPGLALDAVCGTGRHALWLAEAGWRVEAVDSSVVGLDLLQAEAARRGKADRIEVRRINLGDDGAPFVPEASRYDLVCLFDYLHRPMLEALRGAVRPGGRLVAAIHIEDSAKDAPHPYLLAPAELRRMVERWGWEVLHSHEGARGEPGHSQARAEIVARKPG